MQNQDLENLALNLSMVADHVASRADTAVAHTERAAAHLGSVASHLSHEAKAASRDVLATLKQEACAALADGLHEPLANCDKRLRDTGHALACTATAMERLHQSSAALHKAMLWKVALLSLAMSLVMVGGSSWMVWRNRQDLKAIDYNKQVLSAIAAGDLNLCDQRLCVRVPAKAARFQSTAGEYVLLGGK